VFKGNVSLIAPEKIALKFFSAEFAAQCIYKMVEKAMVIHAYFSFQLIA